MPAYAAGQPVTLTLRVLDALGDPVTGLITSDFTITLVRRASAGTSYAAASESVTIASRGSGYYDATYTLLAGSEGYHYHLSVLEKNPFPSAPSVLSSGVEHMFFGTVEGVEYETESDAFCAVSNVEALTGLGTLTSTSTPTRSQALAWMAETAAEIEAAMAEEGAPYTVSTGTNPIVTTDDFGRQLALLCRRANALKPASEALLAHGIQDADSEDSLAAVRSKQYENALEKLRSFLKGDSGSPTIPTPSRDEVEWTMDKDL